MSQLKIAKLVPLGILLQKVVCIFYSRLQPFSRGIKKLIIKSLDLSFSCGLNGTNHKSVRAVSHHLSVVEVEAH